MLAGDIDGLIYTNIVKKVKLHFTHQIPVNAIKGAGGLVHFDATGARET